MKITVAGLGNQKIGLCIAERDETVVDHSPCGRDECRCTGICQVQYTPFSQRAFGNEMLGNDFEGPSTPFAGPAVRG
jgi:hypothetical protein